MTQQSEQCRGTCHSAPHDIAPKPNGLPLPQRDDLRFTQTTLGANHHDSGSLLQGVDLADARRCVRIEDEYLIGAVEYAQHLLGCRERCHGWPPSTTALFRGLTRDVDPLGVRLRHTFRAPLHDTALGLPGHDVVDTGLGEQIDRQLPILDQRLHHRGRDHPSRLHNALRNAQRDLLVPSHAIDHTSQAHTAAINHIDDVTDSIAMHGNGMVGFRPLKYECIPMVSSARIEER